MDEKTLTLSQIISRFLASRRSLSPRTQDYYRNILDGVAYFAQREGWPPPGDISRAHVEDFLDYVAREPHRWASGGRRCTLKKASPSTVHHYGNVLKILCRWAEDEEYLDHNPTKRLRLPRANSKEVEPYSDDEVRAMLDVCRDDVLHRYRYLGLRNQAIISVLTDTGLRLEELTGMRLSDLDPQLRQLRVRGKGSKLRVVPMNGEARKSLKRYLQVRRPGGGDEVWQTDDGGPLQRHSIKIMVSRLKRRAGVTSGGGLHRFRHYFATRYLEAGGDINSLRLLLGHSTLYMVLRYTRYVNVQKALAEHGRFSPLDRLTRGDGRRRDWGWHD